MAPGRRLRGDYRDRYCAMATSLGFEHLPPSATAALQKGIMYASIFRPGLFDGQTIMITGGGSGIGRCTAHELASLGAVVVITGRTVEKLERTAEEIRADGGRVTHYAFDIRDEDHVRSAVAAILDDHGHIDGLVNNAGGQFPMPTEAIGKKGWESVLATNLTGGFLVSREVYTQYMKSASGAIVNMLANVWEGMPLMAHTGAARAGMMNLTQTLALEWAPGVRVNAVAPGYVASAGLDSYDPAFAQPMLDAGIRETPLKRFGEEAEVSSAIVYLLSPAAAYITGICIRVDGGASSVNPNAVGVGNRTGNVPFRGFHRANTPAVLRGR